MVPSRISRVFTWHDCRATDSNKGPRILENEAVDRNRVFSLSTTIRENFHMDNDLRRAT